MKPKASIHDGLPVNSFFANLFTFCRFYGIIQLIDKLEFVGVRITDKKEYNYGISFSFRTGIAFAGARR